MRPRPEKTIFADPKMDVPFKKVFGTAEHKDLLIELLNALLRLPAATRIVDLEYLSPEQLPAHEGLKLSILDVKCTDARGTRYVVEMQVLPVDGFEKRVVLNACKAYVEQLGTSSNYTRLNDVIAVTICNFNLFPDKVQMLSRWQMQEQHSGERGLGQLQYVFLELPKYQAGDQPQHIVEQWAYFFRAAETLWEIPEALSQGPVGKALEVVRKMNFSNVEWTAYEREKMAQQDYLGGITYAQKQGIAQGVAQGITQGRAEGITQGRAEGITQGRAEGITQGKAEGITQGETNALRQGVLNLCEVLQISVSAKRRAQLQKLNGEALATLTDSIKQQRAWPGGKTPPARSARSPRPAQS